MPASVAGGPAGFFLKIYEPVAVRVGEKEHRRVAVEVHDLVVVQPRARLAKPRVGGLGAGRAQPYGHRDVAVGGQEHQGDARPGGTTSTSLAPSHTSVSVRSSQPSTCV